jgi:NADP-dependent 3-hydroxy acid dehydrogenase YdfG
MHMDPDPTARYSGALGDTVALITGAGSGIGRATALAFARAGARVALVGRRAEMLEQTATAVSALGGVALPLPADVTDHRAITAAVDEAVRVLGPIQLAVANAGVNAWGELEELTPEMLRAALATNVEGVVNLARSVVPGMRERGTGRFIVVASDNGRRPEAGGSGYVASKFAAVGFALSLSQELYESGVSVHVIEPGCVDTDWYPPEEGAPRERMLSAEDVALIALFLATLPPHIILEEVMPLPRGLLVEPW